MGAQSERAVGDTARFAFQLLKAELKPILIQPKDQTEPIKQLNDQTKFTFRCQSSLPVNRSKLVQVLVLVLVLVRVGF